MRIVNDYQASLLPDPQFHYRYGDKLTVFAVQHDRVFAHESLYFDGAVTSAEIGRRMSDLFTSDESEIEFSVDKIGDSDELVEVQVCGEIAVPAEVIGIIDKAKHDMTAYAVKVRIARNLLAEADREKVISRLETEDALYEACSSFNR